MSKPNQEGKALGLTSKDGDVLEREWKRLQQLETALRALDDVTGDLSGACEDCAGLKGAARDMLERFFSVAPEAR